MKLGKRLFMLGGGGGGGGQPDLFVKLVFEIAVVQ